MVENLNREKLPWPPEAWQAIDRAVLDEVGRIRIAQRVFPASTEGNGKYVPDDSIDPGQGKLSIPEGKTKGLLELSVDFALTRSQIENEATLRTGRTLAMLAGKVIAQGEGRVFFQGAHGLSPHARAGGDEPAQAQASAALRVANRDSAGTGLLNLQKIHAIIVEARRSSPGSYGENTFTAVGEGISYLTLWRHHRPCPWRFERTALA